MAARCLLSYIGIQHIAGRVNKVGCVIHTQFNRQSSVVHCDEACFLVIFAWHIAGCSQLSRSSVHKNCPFSCGSDLLPTKNACNA